MKTLLTMLIVIAVALPSAAFDLGNQAPAKPVVNHPENVPGGRQGGDTIVDAVVITLPVINLTGTTAGYTDDYNESCPYGFSLSPDVVYTYTPAEDISIDFDMFGSAYDTKIYIYDQNLALIACNDDFYADYTSKLENVPLVGGVQYFLVIDGYGGDFGEYLLNVDEYMPCILECPVGGVHENEPSLVNDYVDDWNGGCSSSPDPILQPMASGDFCGVSGFYLASGGNSRDTDWFLLQMPGNGVLEIWGDAELATYMFELGPQDCNTVNVLQNVTIGPCLPGTMVITGVPGSDVWFWVGPTTFASPDGSDVFEYDYVISTIIVDAVEDHSLSGIKNLFR